MRLSDALNITKLNQNYKQQDSIPATSFAGGNNNINHMH